MNVIRFPFLALALALIWATGCATKPIPDPLAGWKRADYLVGPNETIVKDYQDYIQKLSSEEQKSMPSVFCYENGTGQYAVKISIGLNGTNWRHILIYDKDNKRIKTIKYASGNYRS